VHNYKCLYAAVTIYATLVNILTDIQTAFDQFSEKLNQLKTKTPHMLKSGSVTPYKSPLEKIFTNLPHIVE